MTISTSSFLVSLVSGMRTRKVLVSVTAVIDTDRHGNARRPYYLNEHRGDRVQELEIDMPVRDQDGQWVSRDYMRKLANSPNSPNNLLFEKIREKLIVEWSQDWEEYNMTFMEHGHTDSMDGGTGLVNFIEIESDDEADGSSTATELNLDPETTKELTLFLIEIIRDNAAGGGFWQGDLRQMPNSEDTSIRAREALDILEYSALDHSFADMGLLGSTEIQDIQVPTSVEGETTNLTWQRMSIGDRANVIAELRDHLQEESSFWTSTDPGHLSSEISLRGDTVEDYVERQISMWRGEYVWSDGRQTYNYMDLMYLREDHDTIEQALRQHLMNPCSRNDPTREQNNPDLWF